MSPKSAERRFTGILAISQPQDLPKTVEEVQKIQKIFHGHSITWLNEENATVDMVLCHMRTHRWIHFACHASQNMKEPTSSCFRLHQGTLDIASIMRESFHGDFAFLSACETATGAESLPEEAVHLAAGIMMAGYRAVIGTLWSINDHDGPVIAQEVYSHLYNNGNPDSGQAARALHHAVGRLRTQDEHNFFSWVPFIHMGS
jgi:CHAT domain-containing protein